MENSVITVLYFFAEKEKISPKSFIAVVVLLVELKVTGCRAHDKRAPGRMMPC